MKKQASCIAPEGKFIYGIHKPSYTTANLRCGEKVEVLGILDNGTEHINTHNFPEGDVHVESGTWIFEVANPFPFRGATYIDKAWADSSASDFSRMQLPQQPPLSFSAFLRDQDISPDILPSLPRPLQLTLATCSTDPKDLAILAERSCSIIKNDQGNVTGVRYRKDEAGRIRAIIYDHDLFEAVANNPHLPDDYKVAMVIRPGAQGASEIVGEWPADGRTHVFEYLRRNSYISGGHYAANMADDAIRYSINSLSMEDINGLRHLYYQRMYLRFAELLGVNCNPEGLFTDDELEKLRSQLLGRLDSRDCENASTLWGWNFGFDYSPTDYRLHASHQQIHQQYAVIPEFVECYTDNPQESSGKMASYSCGDMIAAAIEEYSRVNHSELFTDYLRAILNNDRMDGRKDLPASIIVWEDENALLFVPKAQTSQWELQIMAKPDSEGNFPGNILEINAAGRLSLNRAILNAQRVYERLGAKMVTSIEFSKRINERTRFNQPLLYSLLPKLPYSMGAFSEAQLRYINGHYPEDFAAACRGKLQMI